MFRIRYKPTFLLRSPTLLCIVGAGFGAFALAGAAGGGLLLLFPLGLGAFRVFFSNEISEGVAALMARHPGFRGGQPSSLWFDDVEQTKRREMDEFQREMDQFHEATKNNPTLR